MLDYIIKVLLFQTLFLAVYDLLLKRETFFQWNRIYLIVTSLLAYIIPLIKVNRISEFVPQEYVVLLPEVIQSPTTIIEQTFDWSTLLFNVLFYIFWMGIMTASVIFIVKLYRILQLISNNEKENRGSYLLVLLENNSAFSFFNYIFLGKTTNTKNKQQIIDHELVHVQQKHSIDLILFELQRIVCWFNPFSYLYQNRISELHEFIADSKVIKETDKTVYFNNLLAETFGVQNISFINLFFKRSLIKKRIAMLHKNKSKELIKLKYLLLIPVLSGMLIYTSCEKGESEKQNKNEKRLITLYFGNEDKTKEIKSEKEGYFDIYMFGAEPKGKEITYADLTEEEKQEFEIKKNIFKNDNDNYLSYKFYENNGGKRAIQLITDWKGMKKSWASKDYSNSEDVPFAAIDQSPIFPGCENTEDPRKCFQDKVKEHVNDNFDTSITNSLGLESGKKKVYVQFEISKTGAITEIRARGPHEILEKEALRVIKTLPKMEPGEENDQKVAVKYTLPITVLVE